MRCSDGVRQWDAQAERSDDGQWTIALDPGVTGLIPLGFRARLPHGIEAQIRPRSGSAFKRGLRVPNAPGTIDSDYPDEWMVMVQNGAPGTTGVAHGERIAQMVLASYVVLAFQEGTVGVSSTRIGGFGSTGA